MPALKRMPVHYQAHYPPFAKKYGHTLPLVRGGGQLEFDDIFLKPHNQDADNRQLSHCGMDTICHSGNGRWRPVTLYAG